MTTFSRKSSWIHKFIQLVSTHLHLRFNNQTANAMGCFASRNNGIEIVVSVAEATSTSRIRDIPLSHEQKCILRQFWQLIERHREESVWTVSVLNTRYLWFVVFHFLKKKTVESRVDISFFMKITYHY